MIVCAARRHSSLRVRHSLRICAAVLSLSCFLAMRVQAEAVQILVLDGHTGRPVAHFGVSVRIEPLLPRSGQSEPVTDANGRVGLDAPALSSMNAIVNAHPTCRHVAKPDRSKGVITFPVSQILSTGVVEANACSKRTDHATPGVLTLFVRPLHLWERLSD